jgi:hypothetical protein
MSPIREELHLEQHRLGCPARRLERFERTRPRDQAVMTITRCIDCGAQVVEDPTTGAKEAS